MKQRGIGEMMMDRMGGNSSRRAKSVCLGFAEGCPRSSCDTAWLFRYFKTNGWRIVQDARRADLVVVATCGFDAVRENRCLQFLRLLDDRRKPGSELVVVGCLAGIHPERVRQEFRATLIPPSEIDKIDDVIQARVPLREVPPVNDVGPYVDAARRLWRSSEREPRLSWPRALISDAQAAAKAAVRSLLEACGASDLTLSTFAGCKQLLGRQSAFDIRVARGCREECSYCAIRLAAGPLRSKPLCDVVTELDRGLSQGYRVFQIVADDVGQYGTERGLCLADLLTALFSRKGDFQLVFSDINPHYILRQGQAIMDLLSVNRSRVRSLCVPVQSGSDRILQLMRRAYSAADVRQWLCQLHQVAPRLAVETHVLVGFPGETDQDFEQTLELLHAVRFTSMEAYSYSDRPNTLASQMTPKVPDHVIDSRIMRLIREFPSLVSCRPAPEDVAVEPQPVAAAASPAC
jgi:tRNA A37 methylthiotransferase MiaB